MPTIPSLIITAHNAPLRSEARRVMVRLGQVGWDDWLAFAMRCATELIKHVYVLVVILVLVALLCAIFKPKGKPKRYLFGVTLSLLITILIGYFSLAAHRIFILTLLGSEDDALAESAYRSFSQHAQQPVLVKIVNDRREDDNVRFYASCALADKAATNKESENVMRQDIRNAPDIHPRFFNQNAINAIVFPSVVSIPPVDVVGKRLMAREVQHQ